MAIYNIMFDELEEVVHNKAKVGDAFISREPSSERSSGKRWLFYFCVDNNIDENIKPIWMTQMDLLRLEFRGMTLEEKVDFLIEEYIKNETGDNVLSQALKHFYDTFDDYIKLFNV